MKKFALLTAVVASSMILVACTNTTNTKSGEVVLPKAPINQTAQTQVVSPQAQAVNNHAIANAPVTVAQLAGMKDESMVRLRGKVTKALHDEKYEFTDATGTVIVEIDNEQWAGRTVTAADTITIVGELDVEYLPTKRLKVDVDFIEFN